MKLYSPITLTQLDAQLCTTQQQKNLGPKPRPKPKPYPTPDPVYHSDLEQMRLHRPSLRRSASSPKSLHRRHQRRPAPSSPPRLEALATTTVAGSVAASISHRCCHHHPQATTAPSQQHHHFPSRQPPPLQRSHHHRVSHLPPPFSNPPPFPDLDLDGLITTVAPPLLTIVPVAPPPPISNQDTILIPIAKSLPSLQPIDTTAAASLISTSNHHNRRPHPQAPPRKHLPPPPSISLQPHQFPPPFPTAAAIEVAAATLILSHRGCSTSNKKTGCHRPFVPCPSPLSLLLPPSSAGLCAVLSSRGTK